MITPRTLSVVALLSIAACSKPEGGSAEIEEFTSSGIHVIHKFLDANDVVAARLYIDGGSGALTPATAGVEQLYLSTMTRGTEKYDRDAFADLSTSTGTAIGGQATKAWSVATMQAVKENLDQAWDLFTQAVMHPTLPQSEFDLVKQQTVFGLKQRVDDPDAHLTLLSDSVFYGGHAWALDPEGTPESVGALTRDALVEWQKNRLVKGNLLLVVVGNVTKADIEARIASSFGALPEGTASPVDQPAVTVAAPSLTVVTQALPTNYIVGTFTAPSRADADFPAFVLAVRILNDRLFEEVRTKRNLTYAVAAQLAGSRLSTGQLYVTAVEPDTTLKVMFSEVKRIQDEPIPADQMQEAISVFATFFWMGQETNMDQAAQLGNWELTGGGWENVGRYVERLKALTPADLQRVAKAVFKNMRFVVIGDPKKVDEKLFTSM